MKYIADAHDARHVLRSGLPQELGARRGLDDATVLVDHDAVAQSIGLREVVGDEHGGGTPVRQDLPELVPQRAAKRGVQGRQRLVEKEERRIRGESPPEGHALPLTAGDVARTPALEPLEAHARDHLRRAAPRLGARAIAQPETDVVGHGEMREEGVALEDVAHPPSLRREVGSRLGIEEHAAVDDDPARVGPQEARQTLESERLARAGGAEERGHSLAARPLDVEREPGQAPVQADLEAMAHCARAPRRPAATSTAHERTVSSATSRSASWVSPVCTAV